MHRRGKQLSEVSQSRGRLVKEKSIGSPACARPCFVDEGGKISGHNLVVSSAECAEPLASASSMSRGYF